MILKITIPDDKIEQIQDAFCETFNWDGEGTKTQFAKEKIIEFIRSIYEQHQVNQATKAIIIDKVELG